jgi:hypothetical protein
MKTILTNNQSVEEMESQINNFASRLTTGQYKVILYNGQTPITTDNMKSFIDCIVYDLTEESTIQLKGDVMVIHTETETIELKGRKRMSDGEIFARRYLDECEDTLIIKDNEEQIEMREDNFKNARQFYNKCKNIINIRGFFDENDPNYNMNWDAIWVLFRNGDKMLWQRA